MNIYQTCYDLLNTYFFGGAVVAESVQDLACTLISLGSSMFLFAIPFLVVIWLIKLIL